MNDDPKSSKIGCQHCSALWIARKLLVSLVFICVTICLTTGCVRNSVHVPAALNTPSDNSFMDLTAGTGLRIVLPIYSSGGHAELGRPLDQDGKTMVFSASNLAGYEMAHYRIEGRSDGRVRLRFTSAAITRNGVTTQETSAPALAFPLPSRAQHIRLLYLVRRSQVDHNMAIAASKDLDTLDAFTSRFKSNPDLCGRAGAVFCSWVPAGLAVRPE